MGRARSIGGLALIGLLALTAGSAQAMPGDLDASFGTGGKVTTAIGSDAVAQAVALQSDGKIVAAGNTFISSVRDFALARYKADGSLDTGFGTGGKVTTVFTSASAFSQAVAVQPDGRIVAAGYDEPGANIDFALARYNVDGSPDTGFGTAGTVETAFGSGNDAAYALVLQQDGKIVAVGRSYNGANLDFALARYKVDGSPDTTFGTGGTVTTDFGSGRDFAWAAALQPDGKIVAAGDSSNGTNLDFALARYNADGSPDTTFGTGGTVRTPIGSGDDVARAVALQQDGKIVVSGYSSNGTDDDFALARYNSNGSLDTTFGTGGIVTTAVGTGNDDAYGLAIQPDGKIVVAGQRFNGLDNDFGLVRYNADGSLDTGFGTAGKVTTAIGSGNDEAHAVALQTDGRIVAAGDAYNGSSQDFALVRYLGSVLTVTKAGSGTGTVTTSPAGIDCGSTCSAPFAAVPVTLTATAAAGSSFTGWSGECSGTGTCNLSMSADHSAAATFELDKTLTVAKAGSGEGTVTSSPGGIDCGSTCSYGFTPGASITLTAIASAGSTFTGWLGDCSGTGTCTLTMSADHSATATFDSDQTLTVAKAGSGGGTITSSPAGIDCGATCTHVFTHGPSVTLTAAASAGSTFTGWSGDCSGTETCTLTMSASRAAVATFNPLCVVPKVKGKKLAAAKSAITRAHCAVGKIKKTYSSKVKKGRVISQKPAPGATRPQGSKVNLVVSKGKKT